MIENKIWLTDEDIYGKEEEFDYEKYQDYLDTLADYYVEEQFIKREEEKNESRNNSNM